MTTDVCFLPPDALAALLDDSAMDLMKALGSQGRYKAARGVAGETVAHWAAKTQALNCAKSLLSRGYDCHSPDAAGRYMAHWLAASDGSRSEAFVVWLDQSGHQVNLPDAHDVTPLGLAMALSRHYVAQSLVDLGSIDMSESCYKGLRPLELALSLRGSFASEWFEKLVKAGAPMPQRLAGSMARMEVELATRASLSARGWALLEASGLAKEASVAGAQTARATRL